MIHKIREFVEKEIRPCVQGDGGDLEIIGLEGNTLSVAALNECSRCPLTRSCYRTWLEDRINGKFQSSLTVDIKIRKPYFWDK